MLPESIGPDALRTIAVVGLAVLLMLAFLVMSRVRRMVLRVVFLGLLFGLGVYLWAERANLRDCVPTCACSVAGFDVQVDGCPSPDS